MSYEVEVRIELPNRTQTRVDTVPADSRDKATEQSLVEYERLGVDRDDLEIVDVSRTEGA